MGTFTAANTTGGSSVSAARTLLLIDDDELSRELLCVTAGEAGFVAECFESGDAAVAYLQASHRNKGPVTILTDLQMPGLSGDSLALRLRELCAGDSLLLAMSGSEPERARLAAFDGFLLKPFSAAELKAVCERTASRPADRAAGNPDNIGIQQTAVLSEAIYSNLARSMPSEQLSGLYRMCLGDADKRIMTMRRALVEGDDAAYRSAAHSIRGGCGMLGAVELASLAAAMEEDGIPTKNQHEPDPLTPSHVLDEFMAASQRLKRMLDLKAQDDRESSALPHTLL